MTDMRITAKRGQAFYLRAAKHFLEGIRPTGGPEREPVDRLTLSGLGAAICTVAAVASMLQHEGLAAVTGIHTEYLDLQAASGVPRGAPQLVVQLQRKGAGAALEERPQLAPIEELRSAVSPLVVDVRDPEEVEAGAGGPPKAIPGSIKVPLNIDGRPQTPHEFEAKLRKAGALPEDKAGTIVAHCSTGARAARALEVFRGLGYCSFLNGGSAQRIAEAWHIEADSSVPTVLEPLGELQSPLILDVRNPEEVLAGAGGPALPGSVNAPLDCGAPQSERPTTPLEFEAKLLAAGVLREETSRPIVVHCVHGRRAAKAQAVLRSLGYTAVSNGVSAGQVAEACPSACLLSHPAAMLQEAC